MADLVSGLKYRTISPRIRRDTERVLPELSEKAPEDKNTSRWKWSNKPLCAMEQITACMK